LRKEVLILLFIFVYFSHLGSFAKEGNIDSDDDSWETINEPISKESLNIINKEYISNVKEIFLKKCLNCHGNVEALPIYYKIPGVHQLINYDIKQAKKHMDMSSDFPFKGHGNPKDDLKRLQKTISSDSMPLFRYKIMHWGSSLNKNEKEIINTWIDGSIKILRNERTENE
jgi:hypothetical protein